MPNGIGPNRGPGDGKGSSLAVDADVPCADAACKLVAIALGREHDVHGAGEARDNVGPNRPEVGMLAWLLRQFFRDMNHAAVGMRVADPLEAQASLDGLARDAAYEHEQLVDGLPRGSNEVRMARVIGKELSED